MITSRCRSASARIFSDSAAPVDRSSLATRGTLRLHAPVDRFTDLVGQIDPFQADVENLHADFLCILVGFLAHQLHDLVALAGHHVVHGAIAELGAKAVIDRLQQTGLRPGFVTTHADVYFSTSAMRHLMNRSTRTFFFSEVRNRSGSGVSMVRTRTSK